MNSDKTTSYFHVTLWDRLRSVISEILIGEGPELSWDQKQPHVYPHIESYGLHLEFCIKLHSNRCRLLLDLKLSAGQQHGWHWTILFFLKNTSPNESEVFMLVSIIFCFWSAIVNGWLASRPLTDLILAPYFYSSSWSYAYWCLHLIAAERGKKFWCPPQQAIFCTSTNGYSCLYGDTCWSSHHCESGIC